MKTALACNDAMPAGPWYSYDDAPGDMEMKHFTIERDLGPNGQATFIKRARQYGHFVLQATMDFPPDWMLMEINDPKKKQDVDPKCFDALALYYLRYVQEYEKQGILIDYLCLFNEPGMYTEDPVHEDPRPCEGPRWAAVGQARSQDEDHAVRARVPAAGFGIFPPSWTIPRRGGTWRRSHTTPMTSMTARALRSCTAAIPKCRCG